MPETAPPTSADTSQDAAITAALGTRSVVLVGMMGAGKGLAVMAEKFGKIRQVAAIGVKRIGARALFRREHVEEQMDLSGI